MKIKHYLLIASIVLAGPCSALDSVKKTSAAKPMVKYLEYDGSNAFFASSPLAPSEDLAIAELTKKDASWKEGNLFLVDEKRFYESKPIKADPEDKYSKEVTIKLPHHKKALEMFSRSVDISHNPVSAYQGLTILKTVFGTDSAANLALFSKFVNILYEKKNCEGYLEYGNMFEAAKFGTQDYGKALAIYNEGLLRCNKIRPYNFLFSTRIEALKIKQAN